MGEFHSVLEEVSQIQHSTTKYKSMEWQLLEGQRAWLLSRCMAQLPDPACDTAEAQHSSNALELSLRSTKVMGGVVCHVLGEWIISPDAEPPVTKQNKSKYSRTLCCGFHYETYIGISPYRTRCRLCTMYGRFMSCVT